MNFFKFSIFALIFLFILVFNSPVHSNPAFEPTPLIKGDCFFANSVNCDGNDYIAESPGLAGYDGNGWGTESIGYNIFIEKHFPKKVYSGLPYQYKIDVTNMSSNVDLENVNILETFPSGFEVISTEPVIHDSSKGKVAWALGRLNAKETKTITVRGIAKNSQEIPCCTEANFKHPDLCLKTDVLNPGLKLSVKSPAEVLRCDPITLEYLVENTGNGEFKNIEIIPNLPGQVSSDDSNETKPLKVGTLAAGQTKTVRTTIKALPSGNHVFSGSANGKPASLYEGDETASDVTAQSGSTEVRVLNPELKVSASTKNSVKQVIGRTVDYNFEVVNTGNGNANSAILEASIPSIASFQSASEGGTRSGSKVIWEFETLAPGQTKNVSMTLKANSKGDAFTQLEADAICANATSTSTSLPIVGIPALLLEVVDSIDPLEIGDATEYQVRVTNQGNGTATNISLTGQFEDMKYVTSAGHTAIGNTGKTFSMESFSLDPGETVTWKIQLEAVALGDQRFKLIMNSDQLTRPVEETESTIIY